MKRKYCYVTALLLLGLVSSCKQKVETKDSHPISVSTLEVKESLTGIAQEYSGTIQASNESTLSFSTGGTLEKIYVNQGEKVEKGTLLAVVDDTSLRNAYEAAVATRMQAEDAYARMQQLYDNNSLPEIKWTEAQSKLKQAVATEQIAKKELLNAQLYAPFSGFIADKTADVGQNVLPSTPILKLMEINRVKVKIAIPENEIGTIEIGTDVQLTVPALNGRTFEGKITEKGVDANPLSRSYDLYALVDNRNLELLPGMVCDISLETKNKQNGFVIPRHIVQIDGNNQKFVWVYAAGKASKRIISVGEMTVDGVVVTRGLSEGDEIIISGQQKISEGMEVNKQQ